MFIFQIFSFQEMYEFSFCYCSATILIFRDDFDIITAILAGDKTMELRVFSPVGIAVSEEILLTARLCRLMDRYQLQWERYINCNLHRPYSDLITS